MVDRPRDPSPTTGTIHRASIACQSCRLRKVKCDAQFAPSDEGCGPCRRAGHECLLDPLSDGRRSVNRKFVDKLQQRIEMLEALNKRAGDRPDEEDHIRPENVSVIPPGSSHTRSTNRTDAALRQRNNTNDQVPPRASDNSQTRPAWTSASASGDSPEVTHHGSPSFYGVTSHPHVVSYCEESRLTPSDEDDAVDIDLDPTSPHLRDHLFQSFFKYQTLWVDVVEKESFLKHQANVCESRWYSKFLENAMLACGTRLSTSKSVRALGPKYLEWAKEEAFCAMSEPTPANLQGFLLLSEYEVTQGNDRPGWMFCGVACRMLSDLGLHELASINNAPEDTQEPTKESDLAYALLSACVVYEGVWTLYLGRPSSIPRSVMVIAASRCEEERKSDSPWLNAWVRLCVPMAEITHALNDRSVSDPDRSSSLRSLFKKIEEWYDNLPPELAYNESRLTNMDLAGYGLHSQYCKVQILLRRALAKPQNPRKRRHAQFTSDESLQTSNDDSNMIIYKYGLRIARLVVTYREAFGMEKIPSIMLDNAVVAATAMIGHLNKEHVGGIQQEILWLRQLIKSMELVQPHFPIVGRMLDSLKQICGSGPLCSLFPSARQGSANVPAHASPPSTRAHDNGLALDPNEYDSHLGPNCLSINWETFERDMPHGMFSSGELENFVLDIPPSDTLFSSLAQSVS